MPTVKKSSAGRVNKSAWIRAQPSTMKAPEMVALAKREGIQITAAQVYVTRYEARRAAGRKQSESQGIRIASAPIGSKDPKQEFLQLAVRIGTDAAQQILNALQQGKLAQISA